MVQRDYAGYVSGKLLDSAEERLDELTMNWVQFDSLIRRVWESSVVKENIRSEFGLTDEKVWKGRSRQKPAALSSDLSRAILLLFRALRHLLFLLE